MDAFTEVFLVVIVKSLALGIELEQSIFRHYPQVTHGVFHHGVHQIGRQSVRLRVALEAQGIRQQILGNQAVQSRGESQHINVLLAVLIHGHHIVSAQSRHIIRPADITVKHHILRLVGLYIQGQQSVGSPHKQGIPELLHKTDITTLLLRIRQAVTAMQETHTAVRHPLQKVHTSAVCAYPYPLPAVLANGINTVIRQAVRIVLVMTETLHAEKTFPRPCQAEQSLVLGSQPDASVIGLQEGIDIRTE